MVLSEVTKLNFFKALRISKGYTMTHAGQEMGVSISCISMIENNKRNPSRTTIIKFSKFYNVSIDDIFEHINLTVR